jgi:hypothetical protein
MKCFKRLRTRRDRRRKIFYKVLHQSSALLNMIDRRAVQRRATVDQLDVRVLERDLHVNILGFTSCVMEAGVLETFLYSDEMKEQVQAVKRCQHRILTFTLINHN